MKLFLKPYIYKLKIFRGFEIFLGLLFLISAVLKIVEINRFCVQIYAYGVIAQKDILPWIATTTILIEVSLSFFFLFSFPYRKLTMGINLAMLSVFTSLIIYAWIFNDLENCGCFGKIEIGPVESIIKNIILILISFACFLGVRPVEEDTFRGYKNVIKFYLPLLLLLVTTLIICIQQLQSEQFQKVNQDKDSNSPYMNMIVDIDGDVYNLGEGEYLIALLSFGCDHCIQEAPKINEYMIRNDIPKVIALCLEESVEEKEEFMKKVQPLFPISSLGNRVRLFLSLIGKEPPRLVYLKQGEIIKYWDYDLPTLDEIIKETIK